MDSIEISEAKSGSWDFMSGNLPAPIPPRSLLQYRRCSVFPSNGSTMVKSPWSAPADAQRPCGRCRKSGAPLFIVLMSTGIVSFCRCCQRQCRGFYAAVASVRPSNKRRMALTEKSSPNKDTSFTLRATGFWVVVETKDRASCPHSAVMSAENQPSRRACNLAMANAVGSPALASVAAAWHRRSRCALPSQTIFSH